MNRRKPAARTSIAVVDLASANVTEWAQLGAEMAAIDRGIHDEALDAVRTIARNLRRRVVVLDTPSRVTTAKGGAS